MVERCSYCGEEGHSIQQCPKWKERETTSTGKTFPPAFTEEHLDKLLRFRSVVDFVMFQNMYVRAGGTATMAEHLWNKLQRYNVDLLVWWAELDFENRKRFVTMLNAWSGLVPVPRT